MKYILVSVLFIVTAIFPAQAAQGVKSGLELCLSMVIPSLFPLMFSSLLLMRTGIAGRLSRLFAKPVSFLFGLPESACFAVFTAMCGGYPAGAAAVRELYGSGAINAKQAERLSYFAVSAGPAFVLGTVGAGIYKSPAIGALLLSVLCLSVIAVGAIISMGAERKYTKINIKVEKHSGNAFVTSAGDAAKTLLSVCVFVVLFAYLLSLIQGMGADKPAEKLLEFLGFSESTAQAMLPIILEVCGGCVAASRAGLPLVAFALGFGGLSVHFQIFSVLGDIPVNKVKFILIRLSQGMICALLTYIAIPLIPEKAVETLSVNTQTNAMPTASGSVCLVIMCLMAVMCLPKALTKQERGV